MNIFLCPLLWYGRGQIIMSFQMFSKCFQGCSILQFFFWRLSYFFSKWIKSIRPLLDVWKKPSRRGFGWFDSIQLEIVKESSVKTDYHQNKPTFPTFLSKTSTVSTKSYKNTIVNFLLLEKSHENKNKNSIDILM